MKINYWWWGKTFKYRPKRYPNTFIQKNHYPNIEVDRLPAADVIFCFWTGDNELTPNRKDSIETLCRTAGTEVILVTKDNLQEYILDDHPLHPGYQYLSLVHKSDYLRCYFMHHYGGGYSDIKKNRHSWKKTFRKLNNSNKWIAGYPEVGKHGIAHAPNCVRLQKDQKKTWGIVIGNGAYICRPYSPFSYDWYTELHKRMDSYYDELKKHPGNIWGDNEGYPIPWAGILGSIFHPLCLKYHKKLMRSKELLPYLEDYR